MSRRYLNKKARSKIAEKTNNKCGYCGVDLESFQIDHIIPYRSGGECEDINLMAACPSCNRFKGGMKLDVFRHELEQQASRALKNINHKMALRFGQIKETPCNIIFYFETLL